MSKRKVTWVVELRNKSGWFRGWSEYSAHKTKATATKAAQRQLAMSRVHARIHRETKDSYCAVARTGSGPGERR